ncbi:MAG: DUF2628 domain-containing protein [Alphaproteobacteria bacterium]
MLFGTKIYTVHVNPDLPQAYEKPVFVREGFNLYALIFMFMWALYHRLWLHAVALIAIQSGLMYLDKENVLSPMTIGPLYLAFQILIGFHANDWLRAKLQRKGYITADITTGESLLRAEQRFFERHFAAA